MQNLFSYKSTLQFKEIGSFHQRTLSLVQTVYKVKTRHSTNEVDDESAVRETASGMVEEGFSIGGKRDVRKIVRIREAEQVSGVGN